MNKTIMVIFFLLSLSGFTQAQICTPDFCEIPIEESSVKPDTAVTGIAHGYMNAEDFSAFIREKAFGEIIPEGAKENKGFLFILFLAFIGGLALNLSPCVLPLIPVQLAVLGMGKGSASKFSGAKRGLVYALSIALTYGITGIIIVKTGAVFGTLQSRPAFNIAVGVIFVLLALSLTGLYSIDFTRFRKRTSGSLSYSGLILMGITSALLAGACVAPAVIAVIIYAADAYANGVTAALFLPLLLGGGMALPWPVIGAGISFLPKPGRWMNYVKYAFAAVIFALALHYFYLAIPKDKTSNEAEMVYDYTDFDKAFAKARESGKPIVIDFFASWCGSCDEMEKTTFEDEGVKELLSRCEFLRIRVEDPLEPQAVDLLARFNIKGFPAIVCRRE